MPTKLKYPSVLKDRPFAFAPEASLSFQIQQSLRKTPQQERARATVEVLLEATSQVLVDRGYAGLTTTRVADRAGVSVGTLYQYFGDKGTLVRALHKSHIERAFGALASRAQHTGALALEARVEAMLRALLEVKAEQPALSTAIHATMLELDGPAYLRDTIAQTQSLVLGVLSGYRDELTG
ncbi:MAG: helix-turn-helix domain-containing protein, partial [Polyangiales bacterium]